MLIKKNIDDKKKIMIPKNFPIENSKRKTIITVSPCKWGNRRHYTTQNKLSCQVSQQKPNYDSFTFNQLFTSEVIFVLYDIFCNEYNRFFFSYNIFYLIYILRFNLMRTICRRCINFSREAFKQIINISFKLYNVNGYISSFAFV